MAEFSFPVLNYRVIDGDSIEVELDRGWRHMGTVTLVCRLCGIDAPEHGTAANHAVAAVCREWLLARHPNVQCTSVKKSKYAENFIGHLWEQTEEFRTWHEIACQPERTLSDVLLANGLGRPYSGKKRAKWSLEELVGIEVRAGKLLASG
jgi:hypothetical protein